MIDAPVSRNAPCPCGSGRRYKDCHGAIDPFVLEVAAASEASVARPIEAARLLLRAVDAAARLSHPLSVRLRLWTALSSAFIDALKGHDAPAERARRDAYREWIVQRPPGEGRQDIAVILVVPANAAAASVIPALRSIVAQTRPPSELVVASLGRTTALEAIRESAERLPFEVREVDSASSKAAALDAAVAASRSAWIVVLEAPNAFAPDHLQVLVGGVESAGAQWGFTDCELIAQGNVAPGEVAQRRAALDATRTSLAKADSVGQAFIDQSFPAVGDGAVAFSRRLHAAIGGFDAIADHELWAFAVRASCESEPAYIVGATYLHAIVEGTVAPTQLQRESAQFSIFRAFYARALDDAPVGANPFAPSWHTWSFSFLRRVLQSGHILMIDLVTLGRLLDRLDADAREVAPLDLVPGINLIGFVFGEFGLGENLRSLARACEAAGVPFVVNDVDARLRTRQADRSLQAHLNADLRHAVSLMCVNPDSLATVRPLLERTQAAGGRAIGYWYWELEVVPSFWGSAFDAVDEVWCATGFVAQALRRATAKPVAQIPPAIEVTLSRPHTRSDFALPDACFLFLFTFDYNSHIARKNPEAAIDAFRAAFPLGRSDVGLVVKSVNGVHRPDRVARIDERIGGDPRIYHLDTFLDRDQAYGLISVSDAYLSLHRAEGLGFGLAEAMSLGVPTIATGYSGNLEFMDASNSLLVDFRCVPIPRGDYVLDDPRFFWAEPDVDDAARQMRRLADDRVLHRRLAAAGPGAIKARFGIERSATLLRARLEGLGVMLPSNAKPA